MNKRYCNGMVHVIKQGETLYQLSRRYRVPLALILRANPYVDVYNLQVGQEICIPVVRPFNGMVCMPIQQRNDGNPRMMDNRQRQMPDGNEQEMAGQMPSEESQAEMEGMPQQMPQQMPQGGMNQQMPQQGGMMPQSGMAPQPNDMVAQSSQPWPEESPCPCQSQADVYEQNEDRHEDDEVEVYITSGNRSLGDILKEYDVDLDDFVEKNDLSQISICEDVVLYLPKKHNNSRG
ncbi:MAG: LysM peptidoglycan-binding domain-containing protein [Eubacterium sp.]|jgi:LysM repeat protein|nr:LysM peptidoglycan-binding domain-containing protein [Eubacterium sp.]